MVLIKEELGNEWLTKDYFRIGASSLLDDIKKEIQNTFALGPSSDLNKGSSASETKPETPEKSEKGKSKKDISISKSEKTEP